MNEPIPQAPHHPESNASVVDPWDEAYCRFETPEQECRKFATRLRKLGAREWPREARIVEMFCGRGNGLHSLSRLGFINLEGADLSAPLLARYTGQAEHYVCDCRTLPLESCSKDILIVQGGLHHLPDLPDDLHRTLSEAQRVLKSGGLFVVVEPWMTSFLSLVHAACANSAARRLSGRIDALATMIEYESKTYYQWLTRPEQILPLFHDYFRVQRCTIGWGKIMMVAAKV